MIDFSFEYFDDEVREEFYVSGIMKRAWAAQMEVLQTIKSICDKHGITWFVDSGTLLGVVRHKGFIPWDDDLDICMLRKDYERFLQYAKQELPDGYILRTPYSEPAFYEFFSRLIFKGENKLHDFPFAAGVDIFPLDNLSDNKEEEKQRQKILKGLGGILYNVEQEHPDVKSAEQAVKEIEEMTQIPINRKLPIKQQIYICMEQCCKMFSNKPSQYVVNMQWYIKGLLKPCAKKCYRDFIPMPFETITVPVPIGYDEILTSEYGDYHTIKKDFGDHNYPFFKKMEKEIIKKYGSYAFRYEFKEEDLICKDRMMENSLSQRLNHMVTVTGKVLAVVADTFFNPQIENVSKLLEACQTMTVRIGELIESKFGLETEIVKRLEEYCECIFQICNDYSSMQIANLTSSIQHMEQLLTGILETAQNELADKKEIVFLTYKSKYWNQFESLWRDAKDKGYCVRVIPIPYYKLKSDLTLETKYCDMEGFPDDVEITAYEEYDFENNYPDVIYIQNPYDAYNRVVSTDPFFYAQNIRKYTDRLVYVPFFELEDIETEKEKQTMEYFCRVPGVICSDEVILSSEKLRQAYIDNLTELSGEEYRKVWEDKITVRS